MEMKVLPRKRENVMSNIVPCCVSLWLMMSHSVESLSDIKSTSKFTSLPFTNVCSPTTKQINALIKIRIFQLKVILRGSPDIINFHQSMNYKMTRNEWVIGHKIDTKRAWLICIAAFFNPHLFVSLLFSSNGMFKIYIQQRSFTDNWYRCKARFLAAVGIDNIIQTLKPRLNWRHSRE